MDTAISTDTSPEALRDAMITRIRETGYPLSSSVEEALRTVERHRFVPDAPLVDAYTSDIVVTKRGPQNEVLSCLSNPAIVALQLGQLDVRPGHRVLEVGAGAGYNAALLAHLAGPRGHVTTVDVDADVVTDARQLLASADVGNVDVVLGDGALGHPEGAPYDRIIATVGAYGIPDSWLSQLAPGGRLVVPLRIRGSVSRSIAFERSEDGGWHSIDDQMCGFVPLREGIADDPRRMIALTADGTVRLHLNQEHTVDPARLAGVLEQPRSEGWTGVTFGPMESVEWLYLWLACTLDKNLCRMGVEQSAVDSGLVDPMFRWGAMAAVGDGELAYLTWRAAEGASDRRERAEIGILGHGPSATRLVEHLVDEIRVWDEIFQHREVRFEIPAGGTDASDPRGGRFFLDRPHNAITVIWQ